MTAVVLAATGDKFWAEKVIEQAKLNPIGEPE